MIRRPLLLAVGLGTAAVLGPVGCTAHGADPPARATSGTEVGIDLAAMDRTVRPGDDFYSYANGNWMKTIQIPADRSSVGGFYIAEQATEQKLEALIEEIVRSDPALDSDDGRLKAFYTAFLDTAAIDSAGMTPIKSELDRIAGIQDKTELAAAIGGTLRADVDPLNNTDFATENLFGVFVTQALAESAVMPYILQGGLGMPERQYYLSADPKMAAHRAKYKAYVADLLTAAGVPDPGARARRIYDLEMKIAAAHASREESDDWATGKAIWTPADFEAKAPGLAWKALFAAAGLDRQTRFDAYHPRAIAKLSALVGSEPLEAWKDWLAFHRINQNAEVLPSRLDDLRFAFYGTELAGTERQRPREKRAIAALNAHLGGALGKRYVARYFPPSAKAQVQHMVDAIKGAFARRVQTNEVLAPETRNEALAKVRSMTVGVGYPDKWPDYSGLKLDPGSAFANKQAAERLRYAQQLAKIGKPLDRGEWWMNAQLVNAVNLPVQNALNFPAAILQRPFFDPQADPAFNYGAIGAVIGHEISHSFDNNGAAFDASGAMRNWWTQADLARFKEAGKALAEQYDRYEPLPGLHINGELTLGENIADVAGLAAAYDAYRASLGGKEAPVIEGLTGDQRFFIAYAQSWATKMREPQLRQRIATDGHAPGRYRSLTVRNVDGWYSAFDVRPGDELYLPPAKRVRVW